MQSQTNGIRNLQMNNYFQQYILLPSNQRDIVEHIQNTYSQAKVLENEAIDIFELAKTEIEKMILQ